MIASKRLFLFLAGVLLWLPLAAQVTAPRFDPSAGMQQLQRLEDRLAEVAEDERAILEIRRDAAELRRQGEECAGQVQPRISALQSELKILGEWEPDEEIDITEQRRKVNEELARVSARKSNCELLAVRAQQLDQAVGRTLNRISSRRMWSRGPSIFTELEAALTGFDRLPETAELGADWEARFSLRPASLFLGAFVLALAGVVVGIRIRHRFQAWATWHRLDEGPPTLRFLLPRPPAENAPVLLGGAVLTAYIWVVAREPSLDLLLVRAAFGILLGGLGVVFIRWSTNRLSPAARIDGLSPDKIPTLRRRMRACLLVIIAGFILLGPGWLESPPSTDALLVYSLLSLLLAVCLLWVLVLPRQIPSLRHRFRAVRLAVSSALIMAMAASLAGYHNFANYLLQGVLKTLLAAFFLWVLLWMTGSTVELISEGSTRFAHRVRTWLGLSSADPQSGLGLYALVVDLLLWVGFVFFVINGWDTTGHFPQYVSSLFTEGFKIGEVPIVPVYIIYGIVGFVGLIIATGWVKRSIQRRYIHHTRMDRGARDALLKITGYVGFTVAVLVGLKLTGISFAGLAIVAGALSVGIGFGLQNIVNNFVSGLILLFERPIKAGDFVTVGGVEGTVKAISIRSTEIETLDRQNVIVPNSELVSQQVTNWVLHDPHGRLILDIGVAYGSDVEKVREVLEAVAAEHPHVLTDGVSAPKPKVYFMGFGDSALTFELRVWIRQIQRRFDVTSDLFFAIDAAFREHGIEIPFPQRDLHIRSWAPGAQPGEPGDDDGRPPPPVPPSGGDEPA